MSYLLPIGGGMRLTNKSPIVKKFIELSGGRSGVITILPTASEIGLEVAQTYKDFFKELCDDVDFYIIEKREDTENKELLSRLKISSGIFFTGGDQQRITSLLGGSQVLDLVKKRLKSNVIIAGTSAGAAAMSEPMISWGPADSMTKGQLHLSPGLGFISEMVIDSHFIKRGRISRLFHLVSLNPGTLGLGLAEDTGCLFKVGENYFEVLGSRNVTIVDGRHIKHTNIAKLEEKRPFTVTNMLVHVLGPKYKYDYKNFEIILPTDLEEALDLEEPGTITDLPFRPCDKMSE